MGSNATKMVIADFLVSCLWVISGAFVRVATAYIASHVLQHTSNGEILRWVLQVLTMFIFAWVGKLTDGATYNPLTLVLNSVASSKSQSYFTLLLARILAQAFGSLVGVICVTHVMPHGGLRGPMLKVGLKSGMLTEAILTFVIAMVGLITNARGPKGFFLKTWIVSLSKLSLSILGADFTGPAMNPATAESDSSDCESWVSSLYKTSLILLLQQCTQGSMQWRMMFASSVVQQRMRSVCVLVYQSP